MPNLLYVVQYINKLHKQIHLFEIFFQLLFYDIGNNSSFFIAKPN